jgi:molybdopterin-guanine dinucleotide biosynthesis protein A
MTAPGRDAIGGLVLAGGRGTRMGGADKGLLPWRGGTLAGHAVARLAPQVARVAVSANRGLEAYARLGVPVVADAAGAAGATPFDGPLAGLLAALEADEAFRGLAWIALVPCDVPRFPADLVARLAAAVAGGAPAAHAVSRDPATGAAQEQPLCSLVARSQRGAIAAYLAAGRRSARGFLARAGSVDVDFAGAGDDPHAFANANDRAAFAGLHELGGLGGPTDGECAPR